jgi:hypothetical protein
MLGRTIYTSRLVRLSAVLLALAGISMAAPSVARADPPDTFLCVYHGNGDTGDSICSQGIKTFPPFIINSYFNFTRVPWCIEHTNGALTAVKAGAVVNGNANIDAILIAPCADLA